MRIKLFVFTFLFFFSLPLLADKDEKINKKLTKLYEKEKYDKCLKKAISYNKKYPNSVVPEYFMSRINYKFYTLKDQQSIESFINLRNAIRYSNRLPDSSFIIWKDSLQNSLKNFLYINNDTLNTNGLIKKALNFYTESYSDTLDIYFVYYPKETNEIIINNFDESNEIDSLRYKILSIASQQEGIPYKYAGEKPETGFDCSGFTKYVYSSIGVDLPHNAQKQSDIKVGKINLEDAREGDLIFFGYADDKKHYTQHAGIIFSIDNDKVKVIHCVSNGVSIDGDNSSWSHYWKDRVLFVKSMESIIQNSK